MLKGRPLAFLGVVQDLRKSKSNKLNPKSKSNKSNCDFHSNNSNWDLKSIKSNPKSKSKESNCDFQSNKSNWNLQSKELNCDFWLNKLILKLKSKESNRDSDESTVSSVFQSVFHTTGSDIFDVRLDQTRNLPNNCFGMDDSCL